MSKQIKHLILTLSDNSEAAFAKKIDVPQATLNRRLRANDEKKLLELVGSILAACDGLNVTWLITGEGNPYDVQPGAVSFAENTAVQALHTRMQEMERELVEERSLNRKLTTKLLIDGVGDTGAATSTGKASDGHGG